MKNFLIVLVLACSLETIGQESPPPNWFNLDLESDQVVGASVEKAYGLLKNRKASPVIVAVIDSGIDIDHEDLSGKFWINADEIAGNGLDDDNNGYIDDVNGWNFIGGPDSTFVEFDTYELTREYVLLKEKYELISYVPEDQEEEFDYWKDIQQKYKNRSQNAMKEYAFYRDLRDNTGRYVNVIKEHLGVDNFNSDTLSTFTSKEDEVRRAQAALTNIARLIGESTDFNSLMEELNGAAEHFEVQVKYGYNIEYDTRKIVMDDYADGTQIGYGNKLVYGPHSDHGTHVAGIIAADRSNNLGIRGVSDAAIIMPIRAVPNGDERDKDVANAIRYAVDNGARVVNMSFGKYFSDRPELVMEAIKYAEVKGVLLVSSAGNEGKNTDKEITYPHPVGPDGVRASNWISVGASAWSLDENLVGSFSNYGKESVDLFAPGVSIFSTYPEDEYEENDGTSMAAPVVSGVAAMLFSYFPTLTANEVREILVKTVSKFENLQVEIPNVEGRGKLSEISRSGGVVNAARAVQLVLERSKK